MAKAVKNKGIAVHGCENWQPVLLNIAARGGVELKCLPSFQNLRQFACWLLSKESKSYGFIYYIGGRCSSFCLLGRLLGKRMIVHWIGSDVIQYQGRLNLRKHLGLWIHRNLVDLVLADSEIVQEELKEIGIDSHLLRLLPKAMSGQVTALPEEPMVLSYWSDDRFDFYRGNVVFALAQTFPQVTFLIAKATGRGLKEVPSNVKLLGLVENMPQLYKKCTCLVRVPRHDGLSAMVLEALAYGRYVIYSYRFPHTSFASSFDSARVALEDILRKDEPNVAGANHVQENFSIDKEAACLRELFEGTLGTVGK